MTSVAYSRTVMRLLAELRGPDAAVALSPRDWALLFDWERRGVPLATVLEALRDGPPERRSRRGARGPIRLSDVATVVEEAWQVLQSGRSAPAEVAATGGRSSVASWREARRSMDPASVLAGVLDDLLARADRGADPVELDRLLEERLPAVAPESTKTGIESEVDRELAPFRALMAADAFAATRAFAVRDRLRGRLGLPRIS